MSNPSHVPAPEMFQSKGMTRFLIGLISVGAISLIIVLLIGFIAPAGSTLKHQFIFSWLFAFLYFFTILIGCLFWILLHHATDSGRGIVVRRQNESLAFLVPWVLLFFIPLFLYRAHSRQVITDARTRHWPPALKDTNASLILPSSSIRTTFGWVRHS